MADIYHCSTRYTDETKFNLKTPPDVWYLREINLASASKIIASAADRIGGKAPQAYREIIKEGVLSKLPRWSAGAGASTFSLKN